MTRLLALALLLTACAPSVSARRLTTAPTFPAVPADSVRVFADADDLPQPFEVVGYLDTKSGPVITSRGVVEKLRRQAGAMGANAVVYRKKSEFGLGSSGEKDILAVRLPGT